MEKKLCPWQGKMLVMGGSVNLTNSCQSSVLLHMIYFCMLHVGSREEMEVIRTKSLWVEA
jgi:uncharacterized membrane protein